MSIYFATKLIESKVNGRLDEFADSQGEWLHEKILNEMPSNALEVLLAAGDEIFGEGYVESLRAYCDKNRIMVKAASAW